MPFYRDLNKKKYRDKLTIDRLTEFGKKRGRSISKEVKDEIISYNKYLDLEESNDNRTIERLLDLRKLLKNKIPKRTLRDTVLIATWNIRDFDKPTFGKRLDEAYYYIAEIISSFDLIAIQEVYKDLTALERVLKILGSNWDTIFTDETIGDKGNDERLAFLFDKRKISFEGLASELVLPDDKDKDGNLTPVTQIARTPFMVGFRAGWTKFILTTVHIVWGGEEANSEQRVREIREFAQTMKDRTNDDATWSQNIILLGDFNIFGTNDKTFMEIKNAGFTVPKQLLEYRSNALKTRHYDQIALINRPNHIELTGEAGVFDYYEAVFKDSKNVKDGEEEDEKIYMKYMTEFEKKKDGTPRSESSKKNYYKTYWRTHQMSDHLPMWVELKIDFSDEYLKSKVI